jgi:hypothetical protein
MITILTAHATNTAGTAVKFERRSEPDRKQIIESWFEASGAFGSGTLTLLVSIDGGTTWTPHPDFSLTAAGAKVIKLPALCDLKGSVAGGTAASITLRSKG